MPSLGKSSLMYFITDLGIENAEYLVLVTRAAKDKDCNLDEFKPVNECFVICRL